MLSPRDLPLLPVFVAVAEAGSFTTAARELGLAKSVVSLHVRTLEERCGVRLMERSTRRLRLTQVGEQVLEAAREVLGAVRTLEHVVQGHRDAPTGVLRVTVPLDPSLSAMLAPIAAALTRQHPALRIDLSFDDRVHDLIKERFDVAVRLGSVAPSSYVIRRLGTEPEVVVASPTVVDQWGEVQTPDRLSGAPWVVHSGLPVRAAWTFRSTRSAKQMQATLKVTVAANTVLALRDLLVAGAGFGLLPLHVVRDDIAAGRLQLVCPDWRSRKLTLHALLPTRQSPPRVRVFLDRLSDASKDLGFDPT
ncbi:LysR family transcriptional regulator [Labilithrix luteola]|uniref:LysR family transcriptional regulator n=1 Tax=Labilithrix luteola TaxID=1391654 RepID=UPI001474236A|nr:LysR family transcriptional regulator [Labilithrix luteola]